MSSGGGLRWDQLQRQARLIRKLRARNEWLLRVIAAGGRWGW